MANIGRKNGFTKAMLPMAAALAVACSYEINETGNYHCEELSYIPENAIEIVFGGEDWEHYENGISIVKNGDNVTVLSLSNDHNLVVSGITENGSLKIYGNHRMGLYLKGARIANPNGPAINIQNRGETSVHLFGGTENYIADGEHYEIAGGEDAKGAFFSEGKIRFSGCGSLEVAAKRAHAIAVDNVLEIEGGNLKIETRGNDVHGIRTNSDMEISGGNLVVKAFGAGAKGINVKGNLTVTGGDVKVYANDDGVKVHGNLFVNNENFCALSMKKQDIDCNGLAWIEDKCVTGF